MKKSKVVALNNTHLLCYLRFENGSLPDVFVIPYSVWLNPNSMFVDRTDYPSPEYGMNCSKRNMGQLTIYKNEIYLPRLP